MLQVFLVEYSLVHFAPYGEFFLAVVIAVVDEQCYGYLAGCVEVGGERDVDNVAGGMQDVGEPARVLQVLETIKKLCFHILYETHIRRP